MTNRAAVLVRGSGLKEDDFSTRGLEYVEAHDGASPASSDVRAVVYVSADLQEAGELLRLTQWLRAMVERAANHGVLVLVAIPGHDQALARITASNIGPLGRHVRVLRAASAAIAQACLEHDPGPYPDARLDVSHPDDLTLDPEVDLLIRRAFAAFEKVVLHELTGGRSSVDGVWRVEATAADKELRSPFVVKCGPINHISEQVRTYRDVVADRVPFRGCAPLCIERSVSGATRRLSVSRFVEDATRLDAVVLQHDVSELVRGIYAGPLRRWRALHEFKDLKLLDQFIDSRSRPQFRRAMSATHGRLAELGFADLPTPAEVLNKLRALPVEHVPVCRAHDDLNMRNVFVSFGKSDVVLIDFTRASKRPLSRDVARLDVGLGFDRELNQAQPMDEDVLLDFYTGDLFAVSLRHVVKGEATNTRLRAVQTLRQTLLWECGRLDYDPALEYRVGVICELLYHAKRKNVWGRLAYRCAVSLLAGLPSIAPDGTTDEPAAPAAEAV